MSLADTSLSDRNRNGIYRLTTVFLTVLAVSFLTSCGSGTGEETGDSSVIDSTQRKDSVQKDSLVNGPTVTEDTVAIRIDSAQEAEMRATLNILDSIRNQKEK